MDDTTSPEPEAPKAPEGVTISKRTIRLVEAAAAVIILAGLGYLLFGVILPNQETTLTGTITAPECGGGYEIENAAVKITDEGGSVVGAGTTSSDTALDLPGNVATDDPSCTTEFSIPVNDAKFYEVTIGSHSGPTYSKAEMEGFDWKLELSLK